MKKGEVLSTLNMYPILRSSNHLHCPIRLPAQRTKLIENGLIIVGLEIMKRKIRDDLKDSGIDEVKPCKDHSTTLLPG